MITALTNYRTKTTTISYPLFSNKKPVVVKIRSIEDVQSILRIRELKFISNTIRSFINMRHYAYASTNTLSIDREKALKKLRFIVDSYSEGSVLRLAKHLSGSMLSFSTLMPLKQSSSKVFFDKQVIPVLNYCKEIYSESLKN